jgi:rubredoxin
MPTTQDFTCKTCEFSFDSPTGLGQHVAVAHGECAVCGEVFEDGNGLDEHTQESH